MSVMSPLLELNGREADFAGSRWGQRPMPKLIFGLFQRFTLTRYDALS